MNEENKLTDTHKARADIVIAQVLAAREQVVLKARDTQ